MSSTQSESTIDHATIPSIPDPSTVQRRTKLGQHLTQEAVNEGLQSEILLDNLRNEGFTPREANDYMDQFTQLSKLQLNSDLCQTRQDEEHQSCPISPSSHRQGGTEDKERRNREAAEVAWAVLRTRARQILEQPSDASKNAPTFPESLAELFETLSSSFSIPASVLAAAPHLAKLSANIKANAHLEETQRLHSLYTPNKVQDAIVANAQLARTSDPIPRSIWRQITLDQFIDFEKLFASMDKGYEHLDDIKDFGAGFALVKKEQSHKKHLIRDESEWLRVFSAWRSAVGHLYPHHIQELEKYLEIVTDVFRAALGEPHRAIQFDLEVRDHYSKRLFRMDDRDAIEVKTPFDVDKLELMLTDHPNPTFVRSVMKGLREGFWPFDEGNWEAEVGEIIDNYASEELDLNVIRAFHDKEISAKRWSQPLGSSNLLPGMKVSPMFVVWQEKPQAVTYGCNQTAVAGPSKSGLIRLLVASLDPDVKDRLQTGCNWFFTLTIGEVGGVDVDFKFWMSLG
ncbi:hypothetical protein F5887DRAFT_1071128 [Amanita rubescens]|nr:hypothetical protein F5887DRAFT_1071128 [Amanita rubescens]